MYVFSDLTAWSGAFLPKHRDQRRSELSLVHNADRSGWCCQIVGFEPLNRYVLIIYLFFDKKMSLFDTSFTVKVFGKL